MEEMIIVLQMEVMEEQRRKQHLRSRGVGVGFVLQVFQKCKSRIETKASFLSFKNNHPHEKKQSLKETGRPSNFARKEGKGNMKVIK